MTLNAYDTLGTDVTGKDSVDEILEAANCNFNAVPFQPSVLTPEGIKEVPAKAILRDDTYEVLGVHKTRYEPIQYREVVDIALDAVNLRPNDAAVKHAGALGNGKVFFVNIDLGSLFIDPGGINDKVNRFLTAFSSHDGTLPVMFNDGNIRPFCQNQLPSIRKGKVNGFCVKHTRNMRERLQTAKQALGIADEAAKLFVAQANALLARPANHTTVDRVIDKIWPEKPDMSDRGQTIATTRRNKLHSLFDAPTNQPAVGSNGWAVYNTFAEYFDHQRGLTAEKRAVASILPGSNIATLKNRVADLVLA